MEHAQRIRELHRQLESLGYYPHQINDIYRDCIGRGSLDRLSGEEADAIIACLEEYVSFALKCNKVRI